MNEQTGESRALRDTDNCVEIQEEAGILQKAFDNPLFRRLSNKSNEKKRTVSEENELHIVLEGLRLIVEPELAERLTEKQKLVFSVFDVSTYRPTVLSTKDVPSKLLVVGPKDIKTRSGGRIRVGDRIQAIASAPALCAPAENTNNKLSTDDSNRESYSSTSNTVPSQKYRTTLNSNSGANPNSAGGGANSNRHNEGGGGGGASGKTSSTQQRRIIRVVRAPSRKDFDELCELGEGTPEFRPIAIAAIRESTNMVLSGDWTQVELVRLSTEAGGLGFGIVGGASTGVVVKTILPGSPADKDGRLRPGDHILQIGNVNTHGMSSQQVATILRQQETFVDMIVGRPINYTERPPDTAECWTMATRAALNSQSLEEQVKKQTSGLGHAGVHDKIELRPITPSTSNNAILESTREEDEEDQEAHVDTPSTSEAVPPMKIPNGVHPVNSNDSTANATNSRNGSVTGSLASTNGSAKAESVADRKASLASSRKIPSQEEMERKSSQTSRSSIVPHKASSGQPPPEHPTSLDLDDAESAEPAEPTAIVDGVGEKIRSPATPTTSKISLRTLQEMALTVFLRENWEVSAYEIVDVELQRDPALGLGITVAGYVHRKEEIGGVFVKSLVPRSAAASSGRIKLHDLILEVNGVTLEHLSHADSVRTLVKSGDKVNLKLIRFLPESAQAQCLRMLQEQETDTQVIDVQSSVPDLAGEWKRRLPVDVDIISAIVRPDKSDAGDGGLGIALEGTVDVLNGHQLCPHHYIESIRQDGPAAKTGLLQAGDELLQVNHSVLFGESHVTVRQALTRAVHSGAPVTLIVARRLQHISMYQPNTGEKSLPLAYPLLASANERIVKAKSEPSMRRYEDTEQLLHAVSKRLRSRSLEPLSGLAIWNCIPLVVHLMKDAKGLGFSVVDYQDPSRPGDTVIVVQSLVPGGIAQADGRIVPGDRLLFVNDHDLSNSSLERAVAVLKAAPMGRVRLGIAKPVPIDQGRSTSHSPIYSRSERLLARGSSPRGRRRQSSRGGITSSQETVWIGADNYRKLHPQSYYQTSRSPSWSCSERSLNGSELSMSSWSPCSTRSISPAGSPLQLRGSWAYDVVYLPTHLERNVKIQKGALSLGVTLDADRDKGVNGCVVKTICNKKAISQDGRIQIGDYIVRINSESLRNVTASQARAILKRTNLIGTTCNVTYITAADAKVWKDRFHRDSEPQSPVINRLSPKVFPKFYRSPFMSRKESARGETTEMSDSHGADDTEPPSEASELIVTERIERIELRHAAAECPESRRNHHHRKSSQDSPTGNGGRRLSAGRLVDGVEIDNFVYEIIQDALNDAILELAVSQVTPDWSAQMPSTSQQQRPATTPPGTPCTDRSPPSMSRRSSSPKDSRSSSTSKQPTPPILRESPSSEVRQSPSTSSVKSPIDDVEPCPPIDHELVEEEERERLESIPQTSQNNRNEVPPVREVRRPSTSPPLPPTTSMTPPRDDSMDNVVELASPSDEHREIGVTPSASTDRPSPTRNAEVEESSSNVSSPSRSNTLIRRDTEPDFKHRSSFEQHASPTKESAEFETVGREHEEKERTEKETEEVIPTTTSAIIETLPESSQDQEQTKESVEISDTHSEATTEPAESSEPTVASTSDTPAPEDVPEGTSSQEMSTELTRRALCSRTPSTGSDNAQSAVKQLARSKFWGEARTVVLYREPNKSFGISIVGGRVEVSQKGGLPGTGNTVSGIFIKSVLPNSPAGRSGHMSMGDRVIRVNETDLRDATHEQAVNAIKNAENPVRFVLQSLHSFNPQSQTMISSASNSTVGSLPITRADEKEKKPIDEPIAVVEAVEPQEAHPNATIAQVETVTTTTKSPTPPPPEPQPSTIEPDFRSSPEARRSPPAPAPSGDKKIIEPQHSVESPKEPSRTPPASRKSSRNSTHRETPEKQSRRENRESMRRAESQEKEAAKRKENNSVKKKRDSFRDRKESRTSGPLIVSDVSSSENHEEDFFPTDPLPERCNSRDALGIDPKSAGYLQKLPDDDEEEDRFYYTRDKLQRKYSHLPGEIFLVDTDQVPEAGLGMSLAGNKDREKLSVFVVAVKVACPLAVKIGDELLEVNGRVLTGLSHVAASSKIKECCDSGPLVLVVRRQDGALNDCAVKPGGPVAASSPDELTPCMPPTVDGTDSAIQNIENVRKKSFSMERTANIETGRETMIEIDKEGRGLGLSIVGGADTVLGTVVIHEVYPDGAAAFDGRLKPGDQVLEVSGISLRGVSHDQAISNLRRTPPKVRLLIYRDANLQLSLLDPTQIYNMFEVELQKKQGRGLGISIVGRMNEPGVYVSEIVKGGAAEADNRLTNGDQILAVNGQDVANLMQEDVAAILKTCVGKVHLKIGRWKITETANRVHAATEAMMKSQTTPRPADAASATTSDARPPPSSVPRPIITHTSADGTPGGEKNLSPVKEEQSGASIAEVVPPKSEDIPQRSVSTASTISHNTLAIDVLHDLKEDGSETLLVELKKVPDQQLGMGIGKRTRGILVTSLQPGSAAAEKLKVGDRIMAVNALPVSDQLSAVTFVKASGERLFLQIARPKTATS